MFCYLSFESNENDIELFKSIESKYNFDCDVKNYTFLDNVEVIDFKNDKIMLTFSKNYFPIHLDSLIKKHFNTENDVWIIKSTDINILEEIENILTSKKLLIKNLINS